MINLRHIGTTTIVCSLAAIGTSVLQSRFTVPQSQPLSTVNATLHQDRDGDARDRSAEHPNDWVSRERFEPPWRYQQDERRGDRDRDSRGFDRGRSRELEVTPELRERILRVMKDLRPSLREDDIERLRSMPVDDFRDLMTERAGHILYLSRLSEMRPDLYDIKVQELKVDVQVQAAAGRYRMALAANDASAAAVAREELEEAVTKQYDLRLATRAVEIDMFEQRLQRMREDLAHERESKDERIAAWLDAMRDGEVVAPDGAGRDRGGRSSSDPRRGDRDG